MRQPCGGKRGGIASRMAATWLAARKHAPLMTWAVKTTGSIIELLMSSGAQGGVPGARIGSRQNTHDGDVGQRGFCAPYRMCAASQNHVPCRMVKKLRASVGAMEPVSLSAASATTESTQPATAKHRQTCTSAISPVCIRRWNQNSSSSTAYACASVAKPTVRASGCARASAQAPLKANAEYIAACCPARWSVSGCR